MFKLIAVFINELLLLWRDKTGLLVLFGMPAALVLVITLVQENVLKTVGEGDIRVLFVDQDRHVLSVDIAQKLGQTEAFELIQTVDDLPDSAREAKQAVLKGEAQVAIIVPPGMTDALRRRARQATVALFDTPGANAHVKIPPPVISIYFDPTVLGSFRSSIRNSLDMILLGIEIKEQLQAFSAQLPRHIESKMKAAFGPFGAESFVKELPQFNFTWSGDRLVDLTEKHPAGSTAHAQPTSVQQNVPAWALFGMFFIAVPLSGALLKERQSGIYRRLRSLPVSRAVLMMGKMAAYVTVCVAQLILIGLIGLFVLPVLGTPPLEMGASAGGILLMAGSAILAAVGYGILLGTLTGSYEQASMLGPITIVIAAAIGGIMVPVYVMPELMQALSMLSPLAWGLNGFLDVFVRQGTVGTVFPEAMRLLAFGAACLVIAWLKNRRRWKTDVD